MNKSFCSFFFLFCPPPFLLRLSVRKKNITQAEPSRPPRCIPPLSFRAVISPHALETQRGTGASAKQTCCQTQTHSHAPSRFSNAKHCASVCFCPANTTTLLLIVFFSRPSPSRFYVFLCPPFLGCHKKNTRQICPACPVSLSP